MLRTCKTIVLLLIAFFCAPLQAKVNELQLSVTSGELACEAHTAANPLNNDIAVVYKVHEESNLIVTYKEF